LNPFQKEQDGTTTTNRERIIERYTEFYENLYKYAAKNIMPAKAEKVQQILDSEIEKALRR
jgi:hypothetical protein